MADEPTIESRETIPPAAAPEESKNPPWFMTRIDTITRQKHDAERERDALAARVRELETPRATPPATPPAAPAPSTTPVPAGMVPLSEVERIAAQRADEQNYNHRSNEVYAKGKAKFGAEFDGALQGLARLGELSRAHIEAAMETGRPEDVFVALSKDPNEAQRILALPPLRAAAAIAAFGAKLPATGTVAPTVSKAPEPMGEQVKGSTSTGEVDLANDDVPIDAWMAKRNEQVAKNAGR